MTILALSAASVILSDAQLNAGVAVPVAASSGTSIGSSTGFTIAWAPGLIILAVGATSNTITLTWVGVGAPGAPNVTTGSLTAATAYFFGPVPVGYMAPSTGLVSVNITGTVTGARFGGYLMPAYTGLLHNPFEANPQQADF